ncbi:MAG: triose-phosphate isomerase [Sumerlaeia bacterium]
MTRKPFIAGNWKMNCTYGAADDLIKALRPLVDDITTVDIAVCPTFTALAPVKAGLCGSVIQLGAQNLHTVAKDGKFAQSGAYTGEISAEMLKDAGVAWVILGHSERRQYFCETDATVNAKVNAAFSQGLLPIICVGETLDERESGITMNVVETQVRGCYAGLSAEHAAQTVVAYEPVWAIGTGKTASPEQAQEVHAFIRSILNSLYGSTVAEAVRIQYGGSMKPGNAAELLSQPDIDGGLIGGAALVASDFAAIINAAK